jgi:hypothetical protein
MVDMASGRQSDISADTSRSLEAGRIVDRRFEAERGDWPDTRHGHERSIANSTHLEVLKSKPAVIPRVFRRGAFFAVYHRVCREALPDLPARLFAFGLRRRGCAAGVISAGISARTLLMSQQHR